MNKIFCSHCGAEISSEDVFCGSCGQKNNSLETAAKDEINDSPNRPQSVEYPSYYNKGNSENSAKAQPQPQTGSQTVAHPSYYNRGDSNDRASQQVQSKPNQNEYYSPAPVKKKKRGVGCIVVVIALLAIAGVVLKFGILDNFDALSDLNPFSSDASAKIDKNAVLSDLNGEFSGDFKFTRLDGLSVGADDIDDDDIRELMNNTTQFSIEVDDDGYWAFFVDMGKVGEISLDSYQYEKLQSIELEDGILTIIIEEIGDEAIVFKIKADLYKEKNGYKLKGRMKLEYASSSNFEKLELVGDFESNQYIEN